MIHYIKGNIFESGAQALVNTVNVVGVMGKGLALQFRELFPENYRVYRNACKNKELHVGEMLVVEDANPACGKKTIINFPTKTHWRLPSEYSYIEQGLQSLRREIESRSISSVAIPPLGSHNGGLDWERVRNMVIKELSDLDCEIFVYEPSEVILDKMKSERVKLTAARAMLLSIFGDMVRHGEFASVFAAEKIIYFLQRFGADKIFNIDYKPYFYGPYSGGKVAHLLYYLNGSYIKGMCGMDNRPFDYIWLMEDAEDTANKYLNDAANSASMLAICDRTKAFLSGYYSNYTLELLSSVDYLLEHSTSLRNWRCVDQNLVLDSLALEIQQWSRRKEQIFQRKHLVEAYGYLKMHGNYSE